MIRRNWWKLLCIILLVYTCIAGLLGGVPELHILNETIRNLYFHVSMWFAMMIFFFISVWNAIRYLINPVQRFDILSLAYARTGIIFGVLGLITGAIWAQYTWGKAWSNDPKQVGAAIALLIYFAYLVLRNSMDDLDKRARVSAVYNIFAFALLFPTLWIVPRMLESLHPGGMGNPGFDPKDMDSRMRLIFWPAAVPGWTLLGVWITMLYVRLQRLKDKMFQNG
ncbi:MAG TPA: cytochrome c biogenesis protein CcsA [Parasegetibacter sp.]